MGPITRICKVARAKLNLALHVRGRRADGYHDLDSVFVHTVDGDEMWVEPAEDISLTVTGPEASAVPTGETNLVMRAARAVHDAFDRDAPRRVEHLEADFKQRQLHSSRRWEPMYGASRGAAITLVKNLPAASGIGGGSADAAAAIDLLVALWELPDDYEIMHRIAAGLGADVPACLDPFPKHVKGRGENFAQLYDPALRHWPVLLVNPRVELPTGDVFALWDGRDRGPLETVPQWTNMADARNDLTFAAIQLAPVIAEVRSMLTSCEGARLVRMSGSGATCFAIFGSAAERDAASLRLRDQRPDWWQLATRLA